MTDYDCWKQAAAPKAGQETAPPPDAQTLLQEIIGNVKAATENAIQLIRQAVEMMATRVDELKQSPAQRALELAIWSDKNRISADEQKRLAPLWQKYF